MRGYLLPAFSTAFTFSSQRTALGRFYPTKSDAEVWSDWLPFLAKHRIPGDELYISTPRSVEEYQMLAASGAKWMNREFAPIEHSVCCLCACNTTCMRWQ